MATDTPLDFDTLDLDTRQAAALTRRAMTWLGALLLLVAASAVAMWLFLRAEEAREADRRRTADAEWLDQTLRFHFRRLEGDLAALALQAQPAGPRATAPPSGPWWRSPELLAFHGWVPAAAPGDRRPWPAYLQAAAQQPAHAEALSTLLDTTRGLQRPAYAGPLVSAGGEALLWLAVPHFEQGRFVGDHVAAVPVERLLAGFIPAWFLQDHALALADGGAEPGSNTHRGYIAPINLAGAQLRLQVSTSGDGAPFAPRAFFAVAMLCLAGMLLALLALWRDAARRQRAEARLQTQLALRTAMERSVTLGLRAWDTRGRLLYANPAFARLVGWAPAELITHSGPPPYWPEAQGDEFAQLQTAASDPATQQAGVAQRLRHRDGTAIDVLAHSAPLTLASGEVVGWVGSVLDVTERQRVERLAARQQELLEASGRLVAMGEVASTLAHELNQPLGALSGFATGLLNRVRERRITLDEIVPVVERMERMADKAGRVIQRINAFARRQDMTRLPMALAPFVARVAHSVPLPEGVALELSLAAGDGPTVPADALLLENALHNLVLNAGEWAPRSGRTPARVRVSLVPGERQIGVCVADSGPGVPPEQRATVFDAFSSHKPGGMGMGLAICRSIAEAHHGRIELADSPDLLGAKFTLWLPLT
ncbi:MAG: PAS domain S-box protein [Hydrogenophaga sp.]|uniref:sensor histidine kinase n=3 Tax=Hydrogenophaga sp. TaxID=1904254 RepID=UPI0025BC7948|nr:ATP-binding protein [Hydrogenophaga sp.]MBT9553154.1 PAS domain S-box protein [Hydrogenophaga sp.]